MTQGATITLARVGRLTTALVGGYAFAAGLIALLGAGLPHLGMEPSEAATLGAMIGTLVCLVILIWLVASRHPVRSSIIVLIAAAAMILLAPRLVLV